MGGINGQGANLKHDYLPPALILLYLSQYHNKSKFI
jgi:hypothetical protein